LKKTKKIKEFEKKKISHDSKRLNERRTKKKRREEESESE